MPALGSTLHFSAELFDGPFVTGEPDPALTNAQSVSLTITAPDGTVSTPTVTNPPATTGKYIYDLETTSVSAQGRYLGLWQFTLAGGAKTSIEEAFDLGTGLVSLDEALAHLRATGIIRSDPDLDYLQILCLAATDAVERDLGRVVVKREVTETFDGGRPTVELQSTPVISITSVTESGVAVTDFVLRKMFLQRGTTTSRWPWAYGWQNITVTYVAGFNNPPPTVRKVALNLIQGGWQTSQQAPHPALANFSDEDVFRAQATLSMVEQNAYNSLKAAMYA